MKVVVCDKKEIHLSDGPQYAGAVVDLPDRVALRYLEQGAVERYETKVVREVPLPDAGVAEQSFVSPADRASMLKTFNESKNGEFAAYPVEPPKKKRGRPRKASSQ